MPNQHRLGALRVLECSPSAEYDEEAFSYFLAIEQARVDRTHQPLQILLASLEPVPGQPLPFPRAAASRIFDGLREALRDTDVMGWYRQDRVAGVVLTMPTGSPAAEASALLERRVGEGLRRKLPGHLARQVRVRVVQRGAAPARLGSTRGPR